jgi:hypothetical protein
MMGDSDQQYARGYLAGFTIKKILDGDGRPRFDVEMDLSGTWDAVSSVVKLRFTGVRDVRYGDEKNGLNLGTQLFLRISSIVDAGWESIRYKVSNTEQDCVFSLYCLAVEIQRA